MNDVAGFLKALAELTKEYQIAIGGCGDCGSPWLDAKPYHKFYQADAYVGEHLTWDAETQTYSVMLDGAVIARG